VKTSRRLSLILLAAILTLPANATTVIIDFKTETILMVADSRATELGSGVDQPRDNKCKIVILGNKIAFAETGNEGYTPSRPDDSLREWHGTSEALAAYDSVPDHDIYEVALAWSIRVTNEFQAFYLANPGRVRSLALQAQGGLLEGIFAGRSSHGSLILYVANIALDDTLKTREAVAVPIGYAITELPLKDEPYSTDDVTRELIDGKTDRAKQVAKVWAKESRRIPRAKRRLKWLEFLVEKTADYDSQVHGPVNAVEVKQNSVTWLQNETCKDQIHQ
jgi:hypothetical protein